MRRVIHAAGAFGDRLFGISAIALAVVALTAAATVAAEMTELPAGPNRELVAKICASCHDLQMVFDGAGSSRADWELALEEMTANGMDISPEDRAKILDYLAAYLGPSPPDGAAAR